MWTERKRWNRSVEYEKRANKNAMLQEKIRISDLGTKKETKKRKCCVVNYLRMIVG